MDLLWVSLLMVGCGVMMVVMMRTMTGGDSKPPADDPTDSRRAELESEAQALRTELDDRDHRP